MKLKYFIPILTSFYIISISIRVSADSAYYPMPENQVRPLIEKYAHQPVQLVYTIRRACVSGYLFKVKDILDNLCKDQPENPTVMEAYYMVVKQSWEGLRSAKYPDVLIPSTDFDKDEDQANTRLAKAFKIDPIPWIGLDAQGLRWCNAPPELLQAEHGSTLEGLAEVEKAARIAPTVAFTHDILAQAFSLGYHPDNEKSYSEDIKAYNLDPSLLNPAMGILWYFVFAHPDKDQAHKWKLIVLSDIPNEDYLYKNQRDFLDNIQ